MVSDLNKIGIALNSLDTMNIRAVGVDAVNVESYRTAIKGLSVEQSIFALASKGATEEQIRQILVTNQAMSEDVEAAMAKAGLTTATRALTQAEMVEMAAKTGVAKSEAQALLSKIGITATEEGQIAVKKQVTIEMLKQAVTSGAVTEAESTQIATMLGLNTVETANIGITNLLTAAFTKLWAVITAHPIGAILTAVGAVAAGSIAYINKTNEEAENALVEAHENAKQSLEDTKNSLSDDTSKLQSVNSELETTRERLKEISSINAPTLTEQNELNKLSTANSQLKTQKTLLENNIKLGQKAAALDAKKLLDTQVEMKYSSILDNSSITTVSKSHQYKEHAGLQATVLQDGYKFYINALKEGDVKNQELAQELLDTAGGNSAVLTSELLEIIESFKYDDGTIIDGYEDIYNQYMGMIYNLQSLTDPDTFLEIAKSISLNAGIDYEKAISEANLLAYKGNFDITKLNQNFVNALLNTGISKDTINYIFKLKQQEYQSLVDKINSKYDSSKVKSTYWDANGNIHHNYKQEVPMKEQVENINHALNNYAQENPIEFQLVSSYDENFALLDKYIEEEKTKAENSADYAGDYINNAIQRIYDEARQSVSGTPLSDTEILSQVQSLSHGLEQLQSIYTDISDGGSFDWSSILDNENFHATFGGMGDAYEDFIKTVSDAPDGLEECQDAFNELVTDYIHSAKDKNGNSIMGNLTEETKEATIAMLEQMGITNALEIVEQQLAQNTGYLTDAKKEQANICAQVSQGIHSEEKEKYLSRLSSLDLTNATYAEIQSLIDEGNTLGLATNALILFKFNKSQANNESLNTSSDIDNLLSMASAAGIATKSIAKLAGLNAAFQNAADNGRTNEALAISKQMEAAANEAQNDVLNYKPEAKYNGNPHNNTTPLSTNSAPAETKETFNWLETLLSRLFSAFDKLKQKGEDTFLKFTARADSYKSALENVSQQIAAQQQAYDTYMARANSVGLSAEYIDKIQNGSLSIEEISDDSLKEKIKEYQSWYEKALECGTALENLQKTQKELAQEKLETLLTQYDKLLSRLEAKNTRTENYIDLKEVWGGSASKDNYKDMNKNILSQISNLVNQNRWLKNLQSTVENTSEAWYEYGERMEDNNSTIQKLTKSMAENAKAGAALAGQRAEKRNDRKDSEDENTDTKLSTASTSSRKNRLINSKLGNIDGRQGNLKTAYDTSRKARNSYGNKILKANRKDVSKKNKKYFSKAIASVKSGSLIPAPTINGITNAMKTAEGKEYQELSTLLSYCIYYNANKQAEDENKLNYEMYALTAQAEKKSAFYGNHN